MWPTVEGQHKRIIRGAEGLELERHWTLDPSTVSVQRLNIA